MSKPKFTEGEWVVKLKPNGKRCVQGESGRQVCLLWNDSAVISNAHLIAEAPEMYKFLDDLANGRGTDYPIEQLLAKARGE